MRVFCPQCSEPINIADDLAGKPTTCPLCHKAFTAPALFSSSAPTPVPAGAAAASVTTSPPTNSPVGPAAAPTSYSAMPLAGSTPSPAEPPSGAPQIRSRAIGFSLSPEIIQWIAPAALGLCILLTFFSWNGAYPGGHPVYTQGPWGALFGSMHYDRVGEKVIKWNPATPAEGKQRLEDMVSANFLMWLYLPLLFATFAVAVIAAIYPKLPLPIPPNIAQLMPWRMLAVAALAGLITAILALQSARGFGLENALKAKIKAEAKEIEKLPDQPSDEDIQKAEIREGMMVGQYNVRETCALRLVFCFQILAIVGALLTFAMTRRSSGPAPRFDFSW
jgi:hypothetical protein